MARGFVGGPTTVWCQVCSFRCGKIFFGLLWSSVRLRTTSTQWNVPGWYGPHGELFFFLVEERPHGHQGVGSGLGPVSQLKK